MKWMVAALAVTLGGCVSVTELEQSRETLDVISGKSPRAYADCIKQKLADTRDPLTEEQRGDGLLLLDTVGIFTRALARNHIQRFA